MTLRAGSYDANWRQPILRGCIRHDGRGWFACAHDHATTRSARECAQDALPAIRAAVDEDAARVTGPLPAGWSILRVAGD